MGMIMRGIAVMISMIDMADTLGDNIVHPEDLEDSHLQRAKP